MADPEWTKAVDVNITGAEKAASKIAETGQAIALVMDFIAALIRLLAFLFLLEANIFAVLVNLLIDLIEGLVTDLLQNNVAACFHINLNIDPDWKYKRRPGESEQQNPDYFNDGKVPWEGTGLDRWDLRNSVKALMGRCVGIERNRKDLQEAGEQLDVWSRLLARVYFDRPSGWELCNMLTVARLTE